MTNEEDILIAICDWITYVTGEVSVLAYQSMPKADTPFFVVIPVSHVNKYKQSRSSQRVDNISGKVYEHIEVPINYTIRIQYFGENSKFNLENLRMLSSVPKNYTYLKNKNLGFRKYITEVTRIDEFMETYYEERSTVDVMFEFMNLSDEYEIDFFNNAEITGTINNEECVINY